MAISKVVAGGGVIAVVMLVVALLASTADAQKTPETTGSIGGSVTGEHGTPLSGARVTLISEADKTTKTATTDANGAYAFEDLTPGEYDLQFDSKSYVTKTERVHVKAGKKDNVGERMKLPPVPKKPDDQ
jgi:5-hydroxyisourate hydrolase-like protein (transthyretin family)